MKISPVCTLYSLYTEFETAQFWPQPFLIQVNVFSDIRVLSIQIYVLSLKCLAIGINLLQDNGPRD